MQLYLQDFLRTLSIRGEEQVSRLMEEAKVGKNDITLLASRLTSLQDFADFALHQEVPFDFIQNGNFLLNFRDIELQTQELFRVTNDISDLLTAHVNILGSQIKALEDDLTAMEKLAQNYAFLLSEGGTYNFSYLEPFNDERGREDTFTFLMPDRASLVFGPDELAEIRSDEGVLDLAGTTLINHGISGQIIDGNATAFVDSSTPIASALQPNSAAGWRYVVATPNPVTSSLKQAQGRKGAQVMLEFYLSTAAPTSEIKLIPFAEHPIEVLNITVFGSRDGTQPFTVLDKPVLIDHPFTVLFPVRSVAKFRVLLNQPVYERVVDAIHPGEQQYRDLHQEIQDSQQFTPQFENLRQLFPSRPGYSKLLTNLQVVNFLRAQRGISTLSIPEPIYDPSWGPMKIDQVLHNRELPLGDINTWKKSSKADEVMLRNFWFLHRDFDDLFFRLSEVYTPSANSSHDIISSGSTLTGPAQTIQTIQPVGKIGPVGRPSFGPAKPDSDNLPNLSIDPQLTLPTPPPDPVASFNYTYFIGLEYIGAGVNAPGFKGYFVSKPLQSNGNVGELRITASETEFSQTDQILDNPLLTSVEYSVSNVSTPDQESDWIPIQTINSSIVESERFFPDGTGLGFLRFPADRTATIRLFKNGTNLPIDQQSFLYDAANTMITGLKLPLGQSSSTDIFTVSYTPARDETLINFADRGFGDLPLVTAHDATGPGEGFPNTGGRNTIVLSAVPYVDPAKVDATYNSPVKVPLYQPITVQLQDGSVAINTTNYGKGIQPPLPASNPPNLYYIHSGDTLIFSDPITDPFRVFYQYLQNNVRVRVVLRVNSKDFVSPQVDFFQVKARTLRPQTLKVFQ